jgi:phosphoribosylformimino-5-aminoimidazole carboxamide ribotide isomerase
MIEIIPAIDLIDGECVRLRQGSYTHKTVYSDDPLDVAKGFEACGIRRLHLVDLDGAKAGRPVNLHILKRIAAETALKIDFSGGLRSDADLEQVFAAGAAFAGIGSLAVRNPALLRSWIGQYGAERFLIGADIRNGRIAVSGWEQETDLELVAFVDSMLQLGIRRVFCTDIAQDGMLAGPALELYSKLIVAFPGLELIASGGVRNIQDVLALERIGCSGVIIGKAIYEGLITPEELAASTVVL